MKHEIITCVSEFTEIPVTTLEQSLHKDIYDVVLVDNLELLWHLEEVFHVIIPDEWVYTFTTLDELINIIANLIKEKDYE